MRTIKTEKEPSENTLHFCDRCQQDTRDDNICKSSKEGSKDLSFFELEKLMKQGHVYRRSKGGALKQIR